MTDRLYENFNFSLLDDHRFKEESVREELIAPLIQYIGYSNSKDTQVIRNHGLNHPFVTIGSTKRNITLIPDYVLKVLEKPAWILEAKSPSELINESKHAEQAYSYAIHPEIRVNYFALCNGREFVLYNVTQTKPISHIPMLAIDQYKEFIKEVLAPDKIFNPTQVVFKKDLGLHVKRLGFTPSERILILYVKPLFIIKYADNLFSFTAPVGADEDTYLGSFDFDLTTAEKLRPIIGEQAFFKLKEPVKDNLLKFHFGEDFHLNISVSLPEKETLIEVEKEIYLPLIIKDFLPLNNGKY